MWHTADSAAPRQVLARASLAGAGTAYQQGVSLASGLIVARVIGAADYGVFNLARGLLDLVGVVTRLGLDLGLQRYFGEAHTREAQALRIAVLRRLRVLTCGLAVVPLLAVALGLGSALEANVYTHSGFAVTLLWLALALPFTTDIAVLGGAYRGVLKLSPSVLAESVLLPTIRLVAIVGLFVAGWRLYAVAVGTTLGTVLAAGFLAARARVDLRAAANVAGVWSEALRVARFSSVLSAAVLVTTTTATLDVLFLGHFASAQVLGQYALVKTLLVMTGVVGAAFNQTLGSLVAAHHSRGDGPGALRAIGHTARWIALGTVPLVVGLSFWGAALLPLLGESFRTSTAVVAWLAAGQLATVVLGPAGWALSMTGRHVLELAILAVWLAVAVVACALAVPAYGPIGAAVATCCSIALTNALRIAFVRRHFGSVPFGTDVVAIVAVGLAVAVACSGALVLVELPPLAAAALGITCFAAAYAVAAWVALLRPAEKDAVRHLLATVARPLQPQPRAKA